MQLNKARRVFSATLGSVVLLAASFAAVADRVVYMKSSVEPGKYSGPCPVDVVFTTWVDTDVVGEITYRWVRDLKEEGEVLTSMSDGTRHTLEMTWTIDSTPPKGTTIRASTNVLTPSAATSRPAPRAYVSCTSTQPNAGGSGTRSGSSDGEVTPSGDPGDDGGSPGGEDAPIEFGTLETDVIGEDGTAPAGSGSTASDNPVGTIRCPDNIPIAVLDDLPAPWWSTDSHASLTRASVLAADRLLACEYNSGNKRMRLSRKFPDGATRCVVRNIRDIDCTG
jgi:hypothetical protein